MKDDGNMGEEATRRIAIKAYVAGAGGAAGLIVIMLAASLARSDDPSAATAFCFFMGLIGLGGVMSSLGSLLKLTRRT